MPWGFSFNPQFTHRNAACPVFSDDIYAMLLVGPYFKTLIKKPISHAAETAEVITALSFDSKERVNEIAEKGYGSRRSLLQRHRDLGSMYPRCFQDFDGHLRELFLMDPKAMPAQG